MTFKNFQSAFNQVFRIIECGIGFCITIGLVSDQPNVPPIQRKVLCDHRCNFTIESNPYVTFVSLEYEGNFLFNYDKKLICDHLQ